MKSKPLTANLPPVHVRFFAFGPRLSVSSLIISAIRYLVSLPGFSARVGQSESIKKLKVLLSSHAPRTTHHVPAHA